MQVGLIIFLFFQISHEIFGIVRFQRRINFGKMAKDGEFPYLVYFDVKYRTHMKQCSGSIITEQFILTAAHCVTGIINVYAYVGVTDVTNKTNPIVIPLSNIFVHQDYDVSMYFFDLAMMKLPIPLKFNDLIQPIKLFRRYNSDLFGKLAVVAGWGLTEKGVKSKQLLKTTLEIFSNEDCNEIIREKEFKGILREVIDDEICAYYDGTNQGDSGSPLILKSTKEQIGITSWGSSKAMIGYPAVFASVSHHLAWIDKTIQDNSNNEN